MAQQLFFRLVSTKTLLRVAVTALSLAGVAHAQSTDRTHSPVLQGQNFMEGGGG